MNKKLENIKKVYKINNDCIKQLQHCCDDHYQTCEDFTEEERKFYVEIYNWLDKLKTTNNLVIHFVHSLPKDANIEKDIYVIKGKEYNNFKRTEHRIFNEVLDYFGQYEDAWNKKLTKEELSYYGWSSKKSMLESFKLWERLSLGRTINNSSGYSDDLENWTHRGTLEDWQYNSTSIK